jgi:type I restriction enzyme S subunit
MSIDKSLGEVCEFKNSKRKPITASDRKAGPYPYYGAASIQDYVNDYLFDGLHVLVGEDGTVQTTAGRPMIQLVDRKFWVNNHAHILKCEDDLDTRYLAYALREVSIVPFVTGAVQPKVNMSNLKRVLIKWPDKKIRNHIAEIGRSFDDRITLLHETNETLEAIAQALFKSWFVDFDPVRAKQSGKKPEGMDETTASFFPDSFKQSELGEIPTGWEIKKLKEILDLFGGQAFKSKDYISEGIFVLRTNNFKQGIVLKNDNDVFLPNSFLDSYKDFVCEEFDYHLVMVGASIGNTGMIFPHLLPALRNQNMWCFRSKNKQVLSRLYTKFIVDKISKELINFASGSARDFFKRDDFKNHKLIIPHDKVLKSYAEITDPILERISINYNNIDILNNLRNTLLPRLISGKLKMTDMKKEINNKTNVTA